ncbi:unnamed protein product [Rotaria socialis]|uniref:Cadherin domain-containing protein n=2 Tax=Rotaria socialis TaxID=392032 RepID=A0A818F7D9_9BILA|nr:unnamed protein product [Rotaria socialis]CAF4413425.1 unnamed protein product [Rotaria socialis]CAF4445796.1 unnamed protein product [Rotaria socialis]
MNMLFSLLILINFSILYSYSIVSQILPFVSILEESPILTIVVDLRPIFQTLYVNPNQAALLHSQSSQPFEYINGYIRLKSRLDREDYVRKRLCIGGNVLECNFTLTLTVNLDEAPYNYILSQPISCHDINDMIPKFSQSEAKIFMAENVPIGHRIPLEIAIDLDSLPYGIDYYRLETIDDSEQHQFSIVYDNQSRELELIVKEKLDRELIEKYLFKLIAIDRGQPPNVGAQILTIEIIDVNDCRPRFESPVYNVTIAENTVPEYLLKIHAVDNDIGSNAELIYTLENDYDKLFRLDKKTGILTLNQALDYELHKLYQLNVQVHDNGVNPLGDTCIIYVYVLDQNDHAPSIQMKFNPIFEHNQDGNMAYVKESFDINLPLVFVTVFDQDSEDRGKAQLAVEPHRLFYHELIRPNYYAIKANQNFDRESMSSYQIELHARDFGQPSLRRSMTFELNITDINDQIPQFHTNYTFDLIENNRIPTIIGQIHAYDNDQGLNGQITYAIIPESSYFFITANDGTVSTNTSFDYEIKRKYRFQVRARDHGQPPLESFIDVQINIININEFSPTFEQDSYEFFVYENRTIQFIGQVKAYDLDFNDSISYVLRNYEDLFRIDSNGKIFTHVVFDRELQEDYKLTVIATDNSTIGSTIVTIKILDVNDNRPVFIWPESDEIQHVLSHDHSERIDVNNPNAQFITDIIMYDDDIGNNSLIDLTMSDNNELFYVGPNNSLWLRNSSIQPGNFYIELQAKNFEFETKKFLHIIISEENSLKLNLFNNMNKNFHRFSMIIITIVTFSIMSFTIFLIIYYFCIRKNVEKKLYGSRLIVNDEDKSKQNSPQTKSTTVILPSIHNSDYTIITKQRKVPSGQSPSTTDVEFSSSMLSCPFNGISSSSTSDLDRPHSRHHNPHSSAISALTTLTRKSARRQQTKNVSFQRPTTNHMFNDLFQNTSSTFSTLPKQTKYDASLNENAPVLTDLPRSQSNNFPTLQTMLDQSTKDSQTQLPQPPPLLNGILLLDKMLKNSSMSNDDKKHTIPTSSGTNNGWYNVTSNYQTRASIV